MWTTLVKLNRQAGKDKIKEESLRKENGEGKITKIT